LENIEKKHKSKEESFWLITIGIVSIIVYAQTFVTFWAKWSSNAQYSMAPLVPLVSGYFVYSMWGKVTKLEHNECKWGLSLIILALLMHVVGSALDITGPSGISVLVFGIGLLIYFHSFEIVKVLWFPLAYLLFAIPLPGGLIDTVGLPLQLKASAGTEFLLKTLGIDVVRSGVNFEVPGFVFKVAIECSGMSSLVALIGVIAVLAYLSRASNLFKWILFALAIPVAFVANVIRITTIALVGYYFGSDAATNIYHDWSSPILFMSAIVIMLFMSWIFEKISLRLSK
jgi:exosortase